jgi:hypothetical protein
MGCPARHDTNTIKHDTVRHDTSRHERLAVLRRASTPYWVLGPCTIVTSLSRVVLALMHNKKEGHNLKIKDLKIKKVNTN